jgi:hypothetical protein
VNLDQTYSKIALLPFVKAELGFVLGRMCLKARGTATLTSYKYYDDNDVVLGPSNNSIYVSSPSRVVFSLVWMEMSGKWGEQE